MTLPSIQSRLALMALGLLLPMTAAGAVNVSPGAAHVLEQVRGAYAGLTGLELAGTMSVHSEGFDQQPLDLKSTFSAIYSAPAEFCHKLGNSLVLANTPAKLYLYRVDHNDLLSAEAFRQRMIGSELNSVVREDLWSQNPSLLLALVPDAAAELLSGATEASVMDDTGQAGLERLKINRADGELELLIDSSTHLLRSTRRDLSQAMGPKLVPAGAKFTLSVNYDSVTPLASVPADRLAWMPPADARPYQAPATEPGANGENQAAALEGKPAPDFRLKNLDNKWVALADLKGHVVVLDFWATWCGPCRDALPHIDKLAKDKADKGLKVYAIDLLAGQQETPDLVRDFVKNLNLTLPVLLDSDAKVAQTYLVTVIPQTVVIGKDGVVRKVIVGYGDGDTRVQDAVDKALSE
jgi:thiol-disulfide isomerase/thioredoxin